MKTTITMSCRPSGNWLLERSSPSRRMLLERQYDNPKSGGQGKMKQPTSERAEVHMCSDLCGTEAGPLCREAQPFFTAATQCSRPCQRGVWTPSVGQMRHALTSQPMGAVAYKCMYHVRCCRYVYLSLLKISVTIFSDSQRVHDQKGTRKPYYDWKHDRKFGKGRHWSQRMLLTERKQLTAVSCLSQPAHGILCWP